MATQRIHISTLFDLSRAAGIDRFFGCPRLKVGDFERAALDAIGAGREPTLLPMRGDRWPTAVLKRCNQIEQDVCSRMRREARAA